MIYWRMIIVYFVVLFVGMFGFLSIPKEILSYILIFLGISTVGYWLIQLAGYVYDCLYGEDVE